MQVPDKCLIFLMSLFLAMPLYAMDYKQRSIDFSVVTVVTGEPARYQVSVKSLKQSPIFDSLLSSQKQTKYVEDGIELHLPECHTNNFKVLLPLLALLEHCAVSEQLSEKICEMSKNDLKKITSFINAARELNFNIRFRTVLLAALDHIYKKHPKGILRKLIHSQGEMRAKQLLEEFEEEKNRRNST